MPTTYTTRTRPTTTYSTRSRPVKYYNRLKDVNGNLIKDVNGNQIRVRGVDTAFGGTEYTQRTRP